jgi:FixJ family two-component response regulator
MPTVKQTDNIFLVDDDPSVNRALANLLESAGHRVTAFDSAKQFLASADIDAGDCLVLDLCLPGIDGLDLQQTILDTAASIPIVVITGHGKVNDGVRAMKQGAIDFLLKPFDDQALLDAVASAANRNRRHAHPTLVKTGLAITKRPVRSGRCL